jgi:two-component system, NarL family, sensor histidine kinase UhpB
MHKSLAWLLILLVGYGHSLVAQNAETDSLDRLLETAKEDTNKVHIYWKAGAAVIYQDAQAAIVYFKKGAALAERLHFISGLERCHNATSFAFSVNAKYDSALVYINLAVPYAIEAGNVKRLSLAYLNRADVHSNLSNYSAALKDCDTAIQYAEKMTANADALARIYSIMAGVYVDQNKLKEAEMQMDKSIDLFAKTDNRRMIAQMHSNKADLYNLQDQPAKALPLLREAIRIGDSLNDIENLSSYYLTLTEIFIKLKRDEEAQAAAMQSLRLTEQTGNTLQKGNVYQVMYRIAKEKNNRQEAIGYALKAYDIFSQEADTLRLQLGAADLSDAYLALNNPAEAHKYLKISADLRDSLLRKQFNEETAKLQTTFEVREKDKAIQLLNTEKELQNQRLQKQRFIMLGATAIALLAITGIWLLMNRNKLRQRMKELELRNQIAADLHDEVGSSLSSIHMLSQMATGKSNEAAQQAILSRMSTNAKETMDKMGDIVWMIKPGEAEAGSLKQRMERFAYEIGAAKNMEVSVQLDELEKQKLTMEQRKNIYLIFKEAVNNAAKYSGAGKIDICSSLHNRELRLSIKDGGQGFDNTVTRNGNGLGNMQNRARELGGRLEISSAPNEGTTVTLAMPW